MSPSQFGEQSWLLFQTSGHHRGHVPYLQVNTRHNQFDVKDTRQLAPIKAFLLARWRQISSMADRMQVHIWIWRSYQHIAFNFKSNKLHFPLKQHSLRLEMFFCFFFVFGSKCDNYRIHLPDFSEQLLSENVQKVLCIKLKILNQKLIKLLDRLEAGLAIK